MRTRLVLRKETLAELTADELTGVLGGTTGTAFSPLPGCLSDRIRECDSNLRPCISNTCTR